MKGNSGKYLRKRIPGNNNSDQYHGARAYVMWVIDSRKVSHSEQSEQLDETGEMEEGPDQGQGDKFGDSSPLALQEDRR